MSSEEDTSGDAGASGDRFIGHIDAPPEVEIDFDKPIRLVEFYFSSNIQMVPVNASTEKEAITLAAEKLTSQGINVWPVEFVVVNEVER